MIPRKNGRFYAMSGGFARMPRPRMPQVYWAADPCMNVSTKNANAIRHAASAAAG